MKLAGVVRPTGCSFAHCSKVLHRCGKDGGQMTARPPGSSPRLCLWWVYGWLKYPLLRLGGINLAPDEYAINPAASCCEVPLFYGACAACPARSNAARPSGGATASRPRSTTCAWCPCRPPPRPPGNQVWYRTSLTRPLRHPCSLRCRVRCLTATLPFPAPATCPWSAFVACAGVKRVERRVVGAVEGAVCSACSSC